MSLDVKWLYSCKSYTRFCLTTAFIVVAVVSLILAYHHFDPTNDIRAPKCLLKTITGYNCPGCGCQRLMYNWANGRFIEGLQYNYFFPIGIVYLIAVLIGRLIPKLYEIIASKIAIITFIILYITWWIVRNIFNM